MVRGLDADWGFEERRRGLRFTCRHRVALKTAGSSLKGRKGYVVDYSVGGVRTITPEPLKVGDQFNVDFHIPIEGVAVNSLACEVVWCRKNQKSLENHSGLKFLEDPATVQASWVGYFFNEKGLTAEHLMETRHWFRIDCKIQVEVKGEAGRSKGNIRNLSMLGLMAELDKAQYIKTDLHVIMMPLERAGPLELLGRAVEVLPGEMGLFRHRILFQDVDPAKKKMLTKYMVTASKDFWTD